MNATIRTVIDHNNDASIGLGLKFRNKTGGRFYKVGFVVGWPGGTFQYVKTKAAAEELAKQPEPQAPDTHLPELLF